MSEEKKIIKAKETSELHAPIARRLGLHSIGVELDDLCFKTLHPRKHIIIERKIKKQYGNQMKTINIIKTEIENRLKFEQINATIEGRQKQPSSIYNKMKTKSRKFSEVLDMHAFRIIVENTNACYQALGHIHSLYKPIPLKFKDYISAPKPNGYQSLHTVLIGPRNMFIEVQIRSQEMDFISEYGIAAHWHYKNTDKSLITTVESTQIDYMSRFGYKTSKAGFSIGTSYEQYENIYIAPALFVTHEEIEAEGTASANIKKMDGTYYNLDFDYGDGITVTTPHGTNILDSLSTDSFYNADTFTISSNWDSNNYKDSITLNGKTATERKLDELSEWQEEVNKKLAILQPNSALEEQWSELRELRERYVKLEKELIEKNKVWDILKD